MDKLDEISRAFTEIDAVLENSSDEIISKIPEDFVRLVKKYKSKDYEFKYDLNKKLDEQNLSDMTLELIGLIYREFICSSEEKKKYEMDINILKEKLKEE